MPIDSLVSHFMIRRHGRSLVKLVGRTEQLIRFIAESIAIQILPTVVSPVVSFVLSADPMIQGVTCRATTEEVVAVDPVAIASIGNTHSGSSIHDVVANRVAIAPRMKVDANIAPTYGVGFNHVVLGVEEEHGCVALLEVVALQVAATTVDIDAILEASDDRVLNPNILCSVKSDGRPPRSDKEAVCNPDPLGLASDVYSKRPWFDSNAKAFDQQRIISWPLPVTSP